MVIFVETKLEGLAEQAAADLDLAQQELDEAGLAVLRAEVHLTLYTLHSCIRGGLVFEAHGCLYHSA